MGTDTFLSASEIVDCPILEVFDYVANPRRLPEWVPFWSHIDWPEPVDGRDVKVKKGESFTGTFAFASELFQPLPFFSYLQPQKVQVWADDVVPGRRITWRTPAYGWTTICDFEPMGGRTLLTTSHSLWSLPGLMAGYWLGPLTAFGNDAVHRILSGLKRRLENRGIERKPQIFFSYRRQVSRYVGGRIYDALAAEFGEGVVFRDSNSLLAGGNWKASIESAIKGCRVVVVHIGGPKWEQSIVEKIDSENDYLRKELEWATEGETRVIPVVTSDGQPKGLRERFEEVREAFAKLPKPSGLHKIVSGDLQGLVLREDPDFRRDLETLMRGVWESFRKEE
jgi:hypothetical protein